MELLEKLHNLLSAVWPIFVSRDGMQRDAVLLICNEVKIFMPFQVSITNTGLCEFPLFREKTFF